MLRSRVCPVHSQSVKSERPSKTGQPLLWKQHGCGGRVPGVWGEVRDLSVPSGWLGSHTKLWLLQLHRGNGESEALILWQS